MRGFYFITDATLSREGNIHDVRSALAAGVRVVQYREKAKSTKEMFEEALELRRICKNAIFLVNDRVDLALAVKADGVHLGRQDMPYAVARRLLGHNAIIGLTVHSLQQAKVAQALGARYIGVGPIFSTGTKPDAGAALGAPLIHKIKGQVALPVIAIGGITLANAKSVIEAGADGLCAISAVVPKQDARKEIEKFQAFF